ncbi:hypothetical protein Cyrtocomes_01239 [Candidatus Cyrtobacter comes]|uniref:Uncharacterized protein n=1 Tax=Candidatus Cyrtobacter comes TaxID=675776 RepID=A0ABU5L9P5_9RICK|nr:hypothetical protein [Candidatus Cyrtobacter comes]
MRKDNEFKKIINSSDKIKLINNYLNKKFQKKVIGFASSFINYNKSSARV